MLRENTNYQWFSFINMRILIVLKELQKRICRYLFFFVHSIFLKFFLSFLKIFKVHYAWSKNEWMNQEIFEKWIHQQFVSRAIKRGTSRSGVMLSRLKSPPDDDADDDDKQLVYNCSFLLIAIIIQIFVK